MSTDEGRIKVTGGEVWYRRTGDGDRPPLLLLHGGPGASSLAGDLWLGDLPATRQVVLYDQLGSGRSDRPHDRSLWTVERFVAELGQVRNALGLDDVHVLGHSWGAMLLASYLATGPSGVRTATFSSPCLDAQQWARDQLGHLEALPQDVRGTSPAARPRTGPTAPSTRRRWTSSTAGTCCGSTPGPTSRRR